jgi:Domain of unknown function (DUF4760)
MADPDFWLHLLEVIILAAGAFFAIRQLRLQREEIHSNALRERRRQSMEIDARLAEFSAERQKVETAFPPSEWSEPLSLERLQAAFQSDEQLEPDLRQMIVQMDLFALPICANAADEDMAFELIGSTVVAYATAFRNYIMHLRSSQNRPDFYIYLTALVDARWTARDKREREFLGRGELPLFLRSGWSENSAKGKVLQGEKVSPGIKLIAEGVMAGRAPNPRPAADD